VQVFTHLADHLETISHDQINRYLRREKLTPCLLWVGFLKDPLFFTDSVFINSLERVEGLAMLMGFCETALSQLSIFMVLKIKI
jgi:hypothetical protein